MDIGRPFADLDHESTNRECYYPIVRISELSRQAGVPLSAVKYYQREGLIPEGERTAPNQVLYSAAHVQRVRLVRALLETGGLSVAAAKEVVAILDAENAPIAETLRVAQHAMSTTRSTQPASDEARARVRQLSTSLQWRVSNENPGIDVAARAIDGLDAIGFEPPEGYLSAYAAAAASAASADLQALQTRAAPDEIAELMVVGTALGDVLFAGLRRLAQENATHAVFPFDSADTSSGACS